MRRRNGRIPVVKMGWNNWNTIRNLKYIDKMPDAENVKFSKYIVEESRHMGDCSEVETLHLTK